jgi:tRNA isopentenyl-2-thiomethyl-A-37 hydroxylase MiaE
MKKVAENFLKNRTAVSEKAGVFVPVVHMNGDRRETLLDNLECAYMAVRTAMDALRQCTPNGRNAYPVPGLMVKLEAQHRERQEHLMAVYKSLEAEAIALDAVRSV